MNNTAFLIQTYLDYYYKNKYAINVVGNVFFALKIDSEKKVGEGIAPDCFTSTIYIYIDTAEINFVAKKLHKYGSDGQAICTYQTYIHNYDEFCQAVKKVSEW